MIISKLDFNLNKLMQFSFMQNDTIVRRRRKNLQFNFWQP